MLRAMVVNRLLPLWVQPIRRAFSRKHTRKTKVCKCSSTGLPPTNSSVFKWTTSYRRKEPRTRQVLAAFLAQWHTLQQPWARLQMCGNRTILEQIRCNNLSRQMVPKIIPPLSKHSMFRWGNKRLLQSHKLCNQSRIEEEADHYQPK